MVPYRVIVVTSGATSAIDIARMMSDSTAGTVDNRFHIRGFFDNTPLEAMKLTREDIKPKEYWKPWHQRIKQGGRRGGRERSDNSPRPSFRLP